MNEKQLGDFAAQARELSGRLGIGLEAAALIVELHAVAEAFHRVADVMGRKPVIYEMRTEGEPYGPQRTLFVPVEPDA